jgi:LacI family transcriptional regulator
MNKTRYVSDEKVRLIQEAAVAVGYVPNTLARSLKMSSTGTVGLAISAISNPYFSDVICAIEAECSRRDLTVFLCDTQDDPERELAIVRQLHQRRVDGIILAPSAEPQKALDYLFGRLPCALVDRLADDRFDQIGVDNAAAITELVGHAASFGHRRIGFIAGQPGFTTTAERIEAFGAAVEASGLKLLPHLIRDGSSTTDHAAQSAHVLLSLPEPPTAIIAGNNLAMIGLMRAVRERKLHVPSDLSVLGIDDFEWADYFEPRLTLMAQPCAELGRLAADLLIKRIAAPDDQPRTVRLQPVLRTRESCGAPK